MDSLEQLRKQHAEEMIEVENYVTHIRQLSDEREELTKDLEAENEQLKAEMEQMKVEREAGAIVSEEICDMLKDAGIGEISEDSNTVKTQIEYLLKKRAENLNIIKEHKQNGALKSPSWDQEKQEMKDELNRLRDTTKKVKLEMSKNHEKEVEKLKIQIEKNQQQFNEDMAAMLKKFEGDFIVK